MDVLIARDAKGLYLFRFPLSTSGMASPPSRKTTHAENCLPELSLAPIPQRRDANSTSRWPNFD
jgi:hypothetical protein